MKKLLCILPVLALTTFGAKGQGYVYASNITQDIPAVEQPIYDSVSGEPLDSTFYAQLFAGPANSLEAALVAIDNPIQFFDTPAGDFFGADVAIPGVSPGATVTIQVRVWSVAAGNNWTTAYNAALNNGNYHVGKSSLFQNLTGSFGNAVEIAPQLNPNFYVGPVPEPSTLALGALGIGLVLLRRQRR